MERKGIYLKKWILTSIEIAIGILIVGGLVYFASANDLAAVLSGANPFLLLSSIICWMAMCYLNSARLGNFLGKEGVTIPGARLFLANQNAMLLSDFTPGRAGYLALPVMIQKYRPPMVKTFAAVIGFQLIDFLVKAVVSIFSLIYVIVALNLPQAAKIFLLVCFICFSTMVIAGFVVLWYGKLAFFTKFIRKIPQCAKIADKLYELSDCITLVKPHFYYACGVAITGLIFVSLQWWLVSMSCGIETVPLYVFILMQTLVSSFTFIPIGVAGLGIQEMGISFLLVAMGIPQAQAVSASLLVRASSIAGDLVGAFNFLKK